jgi:hypothetical protein
MSLEIAFNEEDMKDPKMKQVADAFEGVSQEHLKAALQATKRWGYESGTAGLRAYRIKVNDRWQNVFGLESKGYGQTKKLPGLVVRSPENCGEEIPEHPRPFVSIASAYQAGPSLIVREINEDSESQQAAG